MRGSKWNLARGRAAEMRGLKQHAGQKQPRQSGVGRPRSAKGITLDVSEIWSVWRHAGRKGAEWRLVGNGSSIHMRVLYDRECEKMRQGGVELRDPDFQVHHASWSPRLRTRW